MHYLLKRGERRLSRALIFGLTVLLPLVAAGTVSADWLVTRDGSRIEIDGPHEVRGKTVVFTLPGGTLSSMRLSEVDLEASAAANAPPEETADEKAVAEEKPPPPPPPPVLVLTNKDIRQAVPPPPPEEEGNDKPEDKLSSRRQAGEVVSWRDTENDEIGGLEIFGSLRNQGRDIVVDVTMTVIVRDSEGEPISSVNAFLSANTLAPRVTTNFRALFPDVYDFAGEPEFLIRSQGIQISIPQESDDDDDAAGGDAEENG